MKTCENNKSKLSNCILFINNKYRKLSAFKFYVNYYETFITECLHGMDVNNTKIR